MRELIETIKAEAQAILDSEENDDRYHLESLKENAQKREAARTRIKQCEDALEAITSAAKHLVGKS